MPEWRSRSGPLMHEFVADEAPQHRRDCRRVLVPLAGIADEDEIGFELVTVLCEKAWQRRRAALFLAFDQHRDRDRQLPGDGLPRPRCLEEGHQLTLVVFGSTRHDHVAVWRLAGDARLERRSFPKLDGIGGLHVVVPVEQHVRHTSSALCAVMRHDHWVADCWHNPGLRETDVLQRRGAPVGSAEATCLVSWIGRNAVNSQKLEQAVEFRHLSTGREYQVRFRGRSL